MQDVSETSFPAHPSSIDQFSAKPPTLSLPNSTFVSPTHIYRTLGSHMPSVLHSHMQQQKPAPPQQQSIPPTHHSPFMLFTPHLSSLPPHKPQSLLNPHTSLPSPPQPFRKDKQQREVSHITAMLATVSLHELSPATYFHSSHQPHIVEPIQSMLALVSSQFSTDRMQRRQRLFESSTIRRHAEYSSDEEAGRGKARKALGRRWQTQRGWEGCREQARPWGEIRSSSESQKERRSGGEVDCSQYSQQISEIGRWKGKWEWGEVSSHEQIVEVGDAEEGEGRAGGRLARGTEPTETDYEGDVE